MKATHEHSTHPPLPFLRANIQRTHPTTTKSRDQRRTHTPAPSTTSSSLKLKLQPPFTHSLTKRFVRLSSGGQQKSPLHRASCSQLFSSVSFRFLLSYDMRAGSLTKSCNDGQSMEFGLRWVSERVPTWSMDGFVT